MERAASVAIYGTSAVALNMRAASFAVRGGWRSCVKARSGVEVCWSLVAADWLDAASH